MRDRARVKWSRSRAAVTSAGVAAASDAATRADRQLLDDLARRGVYVTARQLRRWRAAGVLAPPIRVAGGRGHGRVSVAYPPEAIEQATAIAELVARGVTLDQMPIALFLRGVPVAETALRGALLGSLTTGPAPDPMSGDEDGEEGEDEEEWADRADAMAQHLRRRARRHPVGRHWSARSRGHGERPGPVLQDLLTALTTPTIAELPPSDAARSTTAHVLGLSPDETDAFISTLSRLSITRLRHVAQTTTPVELAGAQTYLRSALKMPLDSLDRRPNYQATGVALLATTAFLRDRKNDSE